MRYRFFMAAALFAAAALLAACKEPPKTDPLTGGNPRVGQQLVAHYGCAACHQIKGIAHADTSVGPSLTKLRERAYVGGVLPNTSENLIHWIMHPHQYAPNTAMPELGVSEADARNIAAYLYNQ